MLSKFGRLCIKHECIRQSRIHGQSSSVRRTKKKNADGECLHATQSRRDRCARRRCVKALLEKSCAMRVKAKRRPEKTENAFTQYCRRPDCVKKCVQAFAGKRCHYALRQHDAQKKCPRMPSGNGVGALAECVEAFAAERVPFALRQCDVEKRTTESASTHSRLRRRAYQECVKANTSTLR